MAFLSSRRFSLNQYLTLGICLVLLLNLAFWLNTSKPTPAAKPASSQPARPQFVRELGGIQEYRLANGLQILLFRDPAQSTTTVNINYWVGSRHESSGEYGMSHLLEHMLFKGTPRHRNIPEATAERGMVINATTKADRTDYYTSFNANPATLAFALELEADRMLNSLIAKADLDKEMSVVRNEFEQYAHDQSQYLTKQVLGTAYQWHNYGHTVIGPSSDIENLPIDRLQAFYKRYYRPDNATLMISGRFELEPTLAQIARLYGPLRSPAVPIPKPYTVEPAQDGERSVVVNRVGGMPMLMAFYHVPAITHPDAPALMLLGNMLSDESRGALYTKLVHAKLALSAGLSGMYGVDPGGMVATAQLAPDMDMNKAEASLLDIVEGRTGPALQEDDLLHMRELAQSVYHAELENPEALMQKLLDYGPDWRMRFLLMEEMEKVTLADLERVRNTYLRPANRTLGRYLPVQEAIKVDIPAAPALEARMAQLKGPPKIDEGEQFDPSPANLAQRTKTRTLASGITVSTLEKHTRGNKVELLLRLRWGASNNMHGSGYDMLGNLVAQGSAQLPRQILQERMTALRASINIQSGLQGVNLRIQAEKDTLLQTLALMAEVMRRPLLSADGLEWIKQTMQANYEGGRQNLDVLAEMAVREYYNQARQVGPGDADYISSVDERIASIKATTLEDVRRFHRDYWSANFAQVAVVGDIPAGLDDTLEHLFGDWKKPHAAPYVHNIAQAFLFAPAHFEAQATDMDSAALIMESHLQLNDREPDYLPLAMAAYIFGNGVESRLGLRIRQQAGLSYGVGATLDAVHFGNAAKFAINATFAPDKRQQMMALVQEELQSMGRNGITAAELARCKHDVLESLRQARASNEILSQELLRQQDNAEDWDWDAGHDREIAAISLGQVNAAWRKHIRPDNFVVVSVGNFKP